MVCLDEMEKAQVIEVGAVDITEVYNIARNHLLNRRVVGRKPTFLSDLGYEGLHDFFYKNIEGLFDGVVKGDETELICIGIDLSLVGLDNNQIDDIYEAFAIHVKQLLSRVKFNDVNKFFCYLDEQESIFPEVVINYINTT